MTKKSFTEQVNISTMNSIKVIEHGITVGMVGWHNKPWKLLPTGATFHEVKEREYKPIAEFRTREELWQYIKAAY